MSEAEKDLVAKMLRAVLQSSKDGVAFTRLQDEYKQLTGEVIPHKQLGFPTLENYLKSIPSVVRCRVNKNGEVICFATVNNDTAHIAKLVARQRSPKKKHGEQTLVNSQLRLKRALPAMQVGKPKETLRQPDYSNQPGKGTWKTNSVTRGKGSMQGTMAGLGREVPSDFKVHATVFSVPKDTSIRKPLSAAINRSEKKPAMTFPPRFQKEQQVYLARKSSSDQNVVWSNTVDTQKYDSSALQSNYSSELVQSRLKEILCKYTNGIWFSKLPQLYRKMFNEDLQQEVLKQLEHWTHVCTVEKSGSLTELLLYPPKSGQQQRKVVFNQKATDKKQEPSITNKTGAHGRKPVSVKSQVIKDTEVKQKVIQLLQKYSSGLWANALPKLFEETYKMQFPQNILDDLDCLSDICSVDYAVSGDRKKAILYAKTVNTDEQNDKAKETLSPVVTPTALVKPEPKEVINEEHTVVGVRSNKACLNTDQLTLSDNEVTQIANELSSSCSMQPVPPSLRIPAEQFPSVLVVELHNTVEAVIRYIGPEYSGALEHMEDSMKEHYTYTADLMPLSSLNIGQLVAVGAEEDSWLRAQIVTVEAEKVKVFFVDHGFNEMVDKAKLYKLDQRFCSLSFQASKCKLAGLEAFCKEPCVLESFELLASGKILLMEILERSEIPLVLLYDTSGDDDFNINAACLKALYDKTLEVNLKENGVYLNVVVTNVCSDGTIYCQVPSKGWNQLSALLEKVEQYFNYRQLTSEYFVSLPFCGKRCLARWRGKWARVEITNVHGARVVDIIFLDIGVVASVAVSELREIPPPFLKDSISIPPQAIKCCLADLTFNIGMWTPDAVMWLRDTVLNCSDCSIKIVKVDNARGLVHIYLFTSKNFPNPERSINHKITNGDLWKHRKDVYLGVERSSSGFPSNKGDANIASEFEPKGPAKELGIAPIKMVAPQITSNAFPPPFALPQPGEHMDVFISVACHPGHFVFQPWQELYKLEVLMEEMVLYYNSIEWQTVPLEKNKIFVAQLDNKWYRVLLKGILTNGLVSVYQLDYGRHELVSCRKVQALVSQFRQLPFQAITAQLAGVKCEQWSEEASIVFRNHVERKPLVAQIQTVQGNVNSWDRKVVTYLVDTSLPDTDVWIHDLLTEYLAELSNIA